MEVKDKRFSDFKSAELLYDNREATFLFQKVKEDKKDFG